MTTNPCVYAARGYAPPSNPLPEGEGEFVPLALSGRGARGEGKFRGALMTTKEKKHRIHPQIRARAQALRQPQTPAEATIWRRLRKRQLGGFKFRRQHPIGRFIADFYCAACQLVIEIDGDAHAERTEYDAARTAWLEQQGYRVIRFTNREVFECLDSVLEAILRECER